MRVRALMSLAVLAAVLLIAWQVVPWAALLQWALAAQREFQEAMARSLRAVQSGAPGAVASLCAATALYGAVHAAGPGHGKVLLGGAALASGATMRRMAVLTVASSLAQALTAIAAVGLLGVLLRMGATSVGEVADAWLAPASYAAIAAVRYVIDHALHERAALHTMWGYVPRRYVPRAELPPQSRGIAIPRALRIGRGADAEMTCA